MLVIILVSLLFSALYAGIGLLMVRRNGIPFLKLVWVGMKGAFTSFLILWALLFFAQLTGPGDEQPLFRLPDALVLIGFLSLQLLYVAAFIYRIKKIYRQKNAGNIKAGSS